MGDAELAGRSSEFAPGLDESSPLVEAGDAVVAVAVGNENISVGSDGHVGWLVEMRGVLARLTFGAEGEEHLAFGRTFGDDVQSHIGHPHSAIAVNADEVRDGGGVVVAPAENVMAIGRI